MATTTLTPDTNAVKNTDGTYKVPEAWGIGDSKSKTDYYSKHGTFTGFVKPDGTSLTPEQIAKFTYSTTTPTTPVSNTDPASLNQIVPASAVGKTQMNVADYAGQVAVDPQVAFSNDMLLSKNTPDITDAQKQSGVIEDQPAMDPNAMKAETATAGTAATTNPVDPRESVGYDATQTQTAVANADMTAAQGKLSEGSKITAPQIDTEATGQGLNEVGKALNASAILDLNDVDARATLKGQLESLQSQFVSPDGTAVIPPWASGLARQVSKIAAFKGVTGTAAVDAMSNALLESSIKIAEQDAKFFQTVSLTNLNNKQQSTINKANVLAQMDLANLDSRTTAAVENAKNFMAMDLANLNNDQQARVINTQQRFQSILEDAKATNAARLFGADSENDMMKFYDTINSQLQQFNAAQLNEMSKFNTGETNDMNQFNSTLSNMRDQFYREMAYNVDLSNAEWRRDIVTTETQMAFEAAAFDAKNMVNVSQEALNQIWDRSDALLDYIWKSAENQMDRNSALAIAKLQAKTSRDNTNAQIDANKPGAMDVFGSIVGAVAGPLVSALI